MEGKGRGERRGWKGREGEWRGGDVNIAVLTFKYCDILSLRHQPISCASKWHTCL